MNKRITSLVALLCVLLSLICCNVPVEDGTTPMEEDLVTITMIIGYKSESTIPDFPKVLEEINKITTREIGVQVNIETYPYSETKNIINKMMLNKTQIDLFYSTNTKYLAENGYLAPLDDLMAAYGREIYDIFDEDLINIGKYNNIQYGIISNRDMASNLCICVRKDILEKYQIDIQSMTDWDGIERVFEVIKENEPDMYCTLPFSMAVYDSLGDGLGVLMDYGQSLEVVNLYETDFYREHITRLRDWNLKGYLLTDSSSSLLNKHTFVREGRLFSYITRSKPGFALQESKLSGCEMVTASLSEPFMTTSSTSLGEWSISSACQHPVEAMKLLNLLYTSPELMNLLCWGIEGVHYVVTPDGTIDYPKGVDVNSTGYNLGINWQLPNQYLAHVWKGDSPTLAIDMKNFHNSAIRSKALGFTFDKTSVEIEYEAVSSVCDVYTTGFSRGELDLDTALPEFIKQLKDAGIDKIIAEKQRQLDQWIAQQETDS